MISIDLISNVNVSLELEFFIPEGVKDLILILELLYKVNIKKPMLKE